MRKHVDGGSLPGNELTIEPDATIGTAGISHGGNCIAAPGGVPSPIASSGFSQRAANSAAFQGVPRHVPNQSSTYLEQREPCRGRRSMKTGIRKGIDVIRLATGLYREMTVSALTLIPHVRMRFSG